MRAKRALTGALVVGLLVVPASPLVAQVGDGPTIEFWYGDSQRYGAVGRPQPFFNVLGNVSDPDGVSSLSYSVNGSELRLLSIGPDLRRLADQGDFNADLADSDLQPGSNLVQFTAVDQLGNTSTAQMEVIVEPADSWPREYRIDWGNVDAPSYFGISYSRII